jgi:hypothetical protein
MNFLVPVRGYTKGATSRTWSLSALPPSETRREGPVHTTSSPPPCFALRWLRRTQMGRVRVQQGVRLLAHNLHPKPGVDTPRRCNCCIHPAAPRRAVPGGPSLRTGSCRSCPESPGPDALYHSRCFRQVIADVAERRQHPTLISSSARTRRHDARRRIR